MSSSPLLSPEDQFNEIFGKLSHDFGAKTKLESSEDGRRNQDRLNKEEEHLYVDDDCCVEDYKTGYEEEEEEEFSFCSANSCESSITAADDYLVFQSHPVYPLFNRKLIRDDVEVLEESGSLRPVLRKIFVEKTDGEGSGLERSESSSSEPQGPYCEWSGRTVEETTPEICKKSNSTGFSKLWRFREFVVRSKSDGEDAFVFLQNQNQKHNHNDSESSGTTTRDKSIAVKAAKNSVKDEEETAVKGNGGKSKKGKGKVVSAHEKHYIKNRQMNEVDKRKTYLPYKPELVGFFTNVNGLSRNVHPF